MKPAVERPTLRGERVVVRAARPEEVPVVYAILTEPSVVRWWDEPTAELRSEIERDLLDPAAAEVMLVVEAGGEIAGGIQYVEEPEPAYRHAGIDVFLGERFQRRGLGTEAVRLLARFLFEERGHHRLTIDPAADNAAAIRCYEKVGFRRVGVLRRYERGRDGTFHDGLLLELLRDELLS